MEEANKLIGLGKKHLVTGKVVEAVNTLQEACSMLAKAYGDTADECGEAFYWCGKALLDLARMENSVLGNALEGVPEDEGDEEKPQDSNVEMESTDNLDETTRDELRVQVYDAMAEKKDEANEKEVESTTEDAKDKAGDSISEVTQKSDTEKKDDDSTVEKDSTVVAEKVEDSTVVAEKVEDSTVVAEKVEDSTVVAEKVEESTVVAEKVEESTVVAEKVEDSTVVAEKVEQSTVVAEKVEQSKSDVPQDDQSNKPDQPSDDKPDESDNKENIAADVITDKEKEKTDETEEAEEDGDEKMEDDAEDAEEAETDEEAKADGEDAADKGSDDEEVGNLQLAWEMLEVAKVIYKRKEGKEDQLMAAQTHLKLGEVSAESGNYTQALEDFQECLKLQLKHLEPDSRLLAETYYQLGLTYSLNCQYKQAIDELNSSIFAIESRLVKLQELIDEAEGSEALPDERKELEELKALLPEIQEKIEDASEGLKTASTDAEAVKGVLDGSLSAGSGDNQISTKLNTQSDGQTATISDISHLVRKKRKQEESPVKEGVVKKVKQDETQTNEAEEPQTNGNGCSMEVESK